MHPTWRDLVIERLADDSELRRHFLARCGAHGIVLALSTGGGAEGERRLPLVVDDDDWDALGDRIYALVPELDHPEIAGVLGAVTGALEAVGRDWKATREAGALARMALERTASTWEAAGASIPLECLDAWVTLSKHLEPPEWPDFLAITWADLLPAKVPDTEDLPEVQRFTDWVGLCELLESFSPDLLEQLGFGPHQRSLMQAFRDGPRGGSTLRSGPDAPSAASWDEESRRARRLADSTVRRVLADL